MTEDLLLWLYLVDAVLMIVHEVDSAYWREWELFGLKGTIQGFVVMHIPLMAVLLWGLVFAARESWWASVFGVVFSLAGLFGFGIHTYFLRKGHHEFDNAASKSILALMLVVSAALLVVSIVRMSS